MMPVHKRPQVAKEMIVGHAYREVMRFADRMGPHEWSSC